MLRLRHYSAAAAIYLIFSEEDKHKQCQYHATTMMESHISNMEELRSNKRVVNLLVTNVIILFYFGCADVRGTVNSVYIWSV